MNNKHILSLLVLLSLALSACAPGAASTPDQAEEALLQETQNMEPTPTQMEESLPDTGSTEEPAQTPAPGDIIDIASADGRFTTLVAAVQAAGLVEALKSEGPFTVFAPTDEAFSKLPEGTLDELLMPENSDQLENILLYHVVEGKVMAEDVVKLESVETLAGQAVQVEVMGDEVMINDAKVIITDIETSNGVIHVIDTVLLP
ncbi:MAG: fasciclin domain-containing protein [Chloroflexi bacterium]|nr:MAG: fasciclin domain-containing protein [Chloroflexota bacterium]